MKLQVAAGILLILTACSSRPPVRGAGDVDITDLARLVPDSDEFDRVRGGSLEHHCQYDLAFVEFNGRGQRANEGQVKRVTDALDRIPADGKSLVVLFVHGWGHSASTLDGHVVQFRKTLSDLSEAMPSRKVFGIYVGWPARWLNGPLHFLTFWDRSRTAQKISRKYEKDEVNAVLRNFMEIIDNKRSDGADVVSVAVGHSLGGKFLFTPMEECLELGACKQLLRSPRDLLPFGDLVLLVNPAQDIHDFAAFDKYSSTLPSGSRTVVAIFSSEADGTVGRTFRIGRMLRNIVTPWNWPDFRSESIGLGWDDTQVTHTLCATAKGSHSSHECDARLRPRDRKLVLPVKSQSQTDLRSYTNRQGPFIIVRVDRDIITDHGDIFNENFRIFLIDLVGTSVGKVSTTAP